MENLSEKEYKLRVERVYQEMQQQQLDALIVYSWKRGQTKYISGYFPNYIANTAAVLVVPGFEPKMYIKFPFDLERARSTSWIATITASGSNEKIAMDICDELAQLENPLRRIGIVGGDGAMEEIPYSFVQYIKDQFLEVEIIDARDIFSKLRIIKSPFEAELISQSATIADKAIRQARKMVAPGVTEMDIVVEAESYIRKNGGGQHLVVIAAPGNRNLIRPATTRKIELGEDIILEAAVEAQGYWSQVAATFYCGDPPAEQQRIVTAVCEAYSTTVAAMHPGMNCAQVAQISIDCIKEFGYGDYIEQDFGHAIGLDLPEPPRLELSDHTLLQEGMIIVVHPAVRVKGVGSAFIGGTTLITSAGAQELHQITDFYQ
jgi:Xaa-Pro aminopeptidase